MKPVCPLLPITLAWGDRAIGAARLQADPGSLRTMLPLAPPDTGNSRCFLATATGYGTMGGRDGKPFLDVRPGVLPSRRLQFTPRA